MAVPASLEDTVLSLNHRIRYLEEKFETFKRQVIFLCVGILFLLLQAFGEF